MRSAIALLIVCACGDDAVHGPAESNPLGSTVNILPYPSSLYERADGYLDVPVGAFPTNSETRVPFDPTPLAKRRGWPASTTILWAARGGVDPQTLVGPRAFADSTLSTSPTFLLDIDSGHLVAHFAEVDVNELDNFDRQAVYIRPMERLVGGHRYAVGIRNTVRARDGGPIPISEGFRAVLEDRDTGHARLDAARPRLRAAIGALEGLGMPRDEMLVAWDFTVSPDDDALVDPRAARDAALAALTNNYTVTSSLGTINGDPRIARRIELDFEAPAVTGEMFAGFYRDAAGNVTAQGTMIAKAYIIVPPCAAFNNRAGILIYGHGFFGSLQELRDAEYARDLSADGCLIVAGTQWTGMSNDDIPNALLALNDLNKGWGFGQRIFQGIVNTIAFEQLLRGRLATEVFVDSQGRSIVDPSRVYFLGISLGHILGTTFFAWDPFITRAVLHVGGANWALMFERSSNWASYGLPLKSTYDDLLDAVIMEQVLQMALEPVDGATLPAGFFAERGKQILMQTSINDCQVPNLASEYQARSLALPRSLYDEQPTPLPPETNETFSYDNVAHENPRRRTLVQLQMRDFWSTGMATSTCASPCNCAAGACGELRTPMYGGH